MSEDKIEQFFVLLIDKTSDGTLPWCRHSTQNENRFTARILNFELELYLSCLAVKEHGKIVDQFHAEREISAAFLCKLYSNAMESVVKHDNTVSSMISALEALEAKRKET